MDVDLALACERFTGGPLGQPANAVTSLAFILAGGLILAGRRGAAGQRWPYAALVMAVGFGSVVQHGPHPTWQAYAHDLPLASLLAFVAADAAADLTGGRARVRHWWLAAPVAMVPVVMAGPLVSSLVQGLLATVAIGLNLARARVRPRWRRTLHLALAVLATGALVGALTDRPLGTLLGGGWWAGRTLCQPESLWQGHAAWHLLAAAALWLLAPAIGSRGGLSELGLGEPAVAAGKRRAPEAEPV